MKYAVAHMNFYDNDLQITIVDAENPIQAMIEGARTLIEASDNNPWINSMLKNIPDPDSYATRIEEIKEEFFNADQVIDVMPID